MPLPEIKMPDNMTEKERSIWVYNYAKSIKLELCGPCLIKLQYYINSMHNLKTPEMSYLSCEEDRLCIDIKDKTWGPKTSCIKILAESILREEAK